jgi:hypothetical protein
MRFHSVAICTLTALLTGGLTAQASESLSSEGSVDQPVTQDRSVVTPSVTSKSTELIAGPELQQKQQSLQSTAIDSRQESRLEPSSSDQNPQAVADGRSGALAEATPQTNVTEIQKAEALHPDNIVTELSLPNANQPASDKSPLAATSNAEALRPDKPTAQSWPNNASQLMSDAQPEANVNCVTKRVETPESVGSSVTNQLAQIPTIGQRCPRPQPIPRLAVPVVPEEYGASPALSIYIPVGFGADRGTLFLSGTYQDSVRVDEGSVGTGGIGIGLGNAQKTVGVELSYAFETTDNDFGDGGFNVKVHRRLGRDLSLAAGWNGFLNLTRNDFEHSKYGVITQIFRIQDSLDKPFSRVAFTVGVGDGQFRSNGAVEADENDINVFGNVALRVVRPISFIAEWTGQDLGLGFSIAPFKNFPFVITPAARDLLGAGGDPRFVIGAGTAIRF